MNARKLSFAVMIAITAALFMTASIAQNALGAKATKKRQDLTGLWLLNLQCDCGGASAQIKSDNAPNLVKKFMPLFQSSASVSTQTNATFNTTEVFSSDGTVITHSFLDYIEPQSTPSQGLWEKTGNGEFALTSYGVLFGSATDPQFQGTYKIRSKVTTDESGDHFTGTSHVEFFDTAGNSVFAFDTPIQAQRAELEPLP